MATETELKLSLACDALQRVARLPIVRQHARGRGIRRHLTNVYYDTSDQRLVAAGVALRVRRVEKRFLQTVKTAGTVYAGMHSRGEWEWELPNHKLDLRLCDAEPEIAAVFVDPALRTTLQPLFTTDFWRTTWLLVFADSSLIELAVDRGKVSGLGRTTPICELELELKAGSPQRLYEVAHALAEALPIRLENTSKAARGYALLAPPKPLIAQKAGVCSLDQNASAEEAFQTIVQYCLDHLHTNAAVVCQGEDTEGVHQMRVATRRLRSCLGLFRPLIPRTASDLVNTEVRWLSSELAFARDWDVFLEETLSPLERHFPDILSSLRLATLEARANAYQRARAAVESARYTRLLLGIGLWRTRCDWRDLLTPKLLRDLHRPAIGFAARVLAKRYARVRQGCDGFLQLSAEERHRLRILCKRLRYAGEFFAALYPESTVRDFLRSVAKVQDILGVLNDAVVASRLLTELGTDPKYPAIPLPARHLVLGWKAAMIEQNLAFFESAWAAFCNQPCFWQSSYENS